MHPHFTLPDSGSHTPRKILLAALAAALTDPLVGSTYCIIITGRPAPAIVWLLFLPNYICAGLATLPARVLTEMRTKMERARRFGSYVLEERLGRGAMGEVWRAQHHLLARPAAIKIIRAKTLGESDALRAREILQRFEREVQATAALGSPHTVEVFDFGHDDTGTFYYVMALLHGVDFETLAKRVGPLPPERVRQILLQACHSLHDAHQNGLIQRDIKPANIFICRQGQDFDFVKILDFGLVKSTGPPPPDLEAVIMQCLEKDSERRPADARILAERLEAYRIDDTYDARSLREWWETHMPV